MNIYYIISEYHDIIRYYRIYVKGTAYIYIYKYIYSTFNILACQAMQLDPVGNLQKFRHGKKKQ